MPMMRRGFPSPQDRSRVKTETPEGFSVFNLEKQLFCVIVAAWNGL